MSLDFTAAGLTYLNTYKGGPVVISGQLDTLSAVVGTDEVVFGLSKSLIPGVVTPHPSIAGPHPPRRSKSQRFPNQPVTPSHQVLSLSGLRSLADGARAGGLLPRYRNRALDQV